MKTMSCTLCSFAYDEEQGYPADNIAPGTRFEDLPENWTCPDCGAPKSEFEEIDL
jgi:rubredoxin